MWRRKLTTRDDLNIKEFIGYILPDGKFLNLLENGFPTHCHYEHFLIKKGELKPCGHSGMRQLTNLNQWIRVNDGTHVAYEVLAELPIKGLTDEQYESLDKYLNYLRDKKREFIEIGIEEHSVGTHFTDKSLWYDRFYFDQFTNKEIIFFIQDAYRIFEMYPEEKNEEKEN